VCAAWKAVYDALVTRVVLRPRSTDTAIGMLVRRFPAVVSLELSLELELKGGAGNGVTDEGMRAVSSLTSITSLDISGCVLMTNEGLRAVSNLRALTCLDLTSCGRVTDAGVLAVIK
jgi:hypothetical protein